MVARYLFGLTLLLFVVASCFPHLRVWGLSVWAHFPIYIPILLSVVGVAIGVIDYLSGKKHKVKKVELEVDSTRPYILLSIFIIGLFGALLYLLRAKTFFLGDGYTLVAELANAQPLVKPREIGAGLTLLWVRNLIGGDPERASQLAYQIVSIGAGIVFATIAAIGSAILFGRLRERLILLIGLLSGGYSLMFFGYAENYSLFATGLLFFCILGLLITQNRANKWLIVIPLSLACFLHILGTLLIPAAIYLVLGRTRIAEVMTGAFKTKKLTVIGIPAVLGSVAFGYLYQTDYYFRFAFVPISPDRFSIKGYSLFSVAHVADVINLLFLVAPGLLLVVALLRMQPIKRLFETRSARFLLLLVATTLLAVCLLDPKLGMPRDWDLFSLPGVPIVTLMLWLLLTRPTQTRTHTTIAILFVSLGLISLLPRAGAQAFPSVSVPTFTNYLELDPERARTGMYNLATYFVSQGDTAAARRSEEKRAVLFPYENYIRIADNAAKEEQFGVAKAYTQRALASNSTLADSWLVLAKCYIAERKFDSALEATKIADGLNPYNILTLNEMALAHLYLRHSDEAVEIWLDLSKRDTSDYGIPFNIARHYQLQGNTALYEHYLTIAAARSNALPEFSIELAKFKLAKGDVQAAAVACRQALAKGADQSRISALTASNYRLAELMSQNSK